MRFVDNDPIFKTLNIQDKEQNNQKQHKLTSV